jgi:hypothetical protein
MLPERLKLLVEKPVREGEVSWKEGKGRKRKRTLFRCVFESAQRRILSQPGGEGTRESVDVVSAVVPSEKDGEKDDGEEGKVESVAHRWLESGFWRFLVLLGGSNRRWMG